LFLWTNAIPLRAVLPCFCTNMPVVQDIRKRSEYLIIN
jgi:hypothetical protein